MRTRVKICGITRVEDALAAAHGGADAIGLVFHPASPRALTIEQAQLVARAVPPFVTVVGLFVDAPAERIRRVLSGVPLDLLQFHGNESAEQCARHGRPYIKAVRMTEGLDLKAHTRAYPDAAGFLLDAYHPAVAGGSGECFDWARVPRCFDRPLILAGGLTPANVVEAIGVAQPYAVDVSSGVESGKGIKDAAKIAAFLQAVAGVTAAGQ